MSTPQPRRPYPTDLTDQQWAMIEPWVRRAGGPGAHPVGLARSGQCLALHESYRLYLLADAVAP